MPCVFSLSRTGRGDFLFEREAHRPRVDWPSPWTPISACISTPTATLTSIWAYFTHSCASQRAA